MRTFTNSFRKRVFLYINIRGGNSSWLITFSKNFILFNNGKKHLILMLSVTYTTFTYVKSTHTYLGSFCFFCSFIFIFFHYSTNFTYFRYMNNLLINQQQFLLSLKFTIISNFIFKLRIFCNTIIDTLFHHIKHLSVSQNQAQLSVQLNIMQSFV